MKNAHNNAQSAAHQASPSPAVAHLASLDSCSADNTLAVLPAVDYAAPDLSQLLFMIEEEKLAGDVYDALFTQTGLIVFDRIGDAEDRHMMTLLDHAQTLGLDVDGIISLPAGSYFEPELQTLYATLLATASVSGDAALQVGAVIEMADIADLELAMVDLVGTPLGSAYAQLLNGSNHHLTAFESMLA